MRQVNPLVEGSSPSPVICDRTRQNTSKTVSRKTLRQPHPDSRSRTEPTLSASIRPPTATPNATRMLPDDRDLAAVVDAWPDLPEAIRAGIVAMVKAARP